ncbi:MAG: hypothetical protein GF384_04380 [Elusimicrobia bacterium]|nr:hypothetical protein [Elusimicrobiota bacterium]MBD3412095.1 hypothetical protein [Elusimicrobiota bacterium]
MKLFLIVFLMASIPLYAGGRKPPAQLPDEPVVGEYPDEVESFSYENDEIEYHEPQKNAGYYQESPPPDRQEPEEQAELPGVPQKLPGIPKEPGEVEQSFDEESQIDEEYVETDHEETSWKEDATIHRVWIWQETGDCLWNLAKEYYGDPWKWKLIYLANQDVIMNPSKIFPKQELIIPSEQAWYEEH